MSNRRSRHPVKRDACSDGLCQAAVDDFAACLRGRGYAASTISQYLLIVEQFRTWLRASGKRKQPVREAFVSSFVDKCRTKHRLRHVGHLRAALGHLVQLLRDRGELADAPTPPPTVIDVAIQGFTSHLRNTCGFAESTCRVRACYVRRFLECKFGNGPLNLKSLCRDDLVNFVTGHSEQNARVAPRVLASSLRAYLRYLQLQGICGAQLVAAVPTTRRSKLANLPRTMTEEQLRTFLSSFDRSTAIGRRNYAIALLMSTLGLRAGEVGLLQLDDLNWRDSSVRIVSPKTRRTNVLPLPADVGKAIADYLHHGRPTTSHRHVFARHIAPRGIPLNAPLIRAMAVRAYRRCGFDPRWNGTHILRHTMATHMHQRGVALKEVADLLGHRSIETSAIYAKVNLSALTAVALPWPEVTT